MHEYMRAVGFSNGLTREKFKKLVSLVIRDSDESRVVSGGEGILRIEYRKYFGEKIGLIVRGTFETAESGEDEFFIDYTVPFLKATAISSTDKITFERYSEKECYAGICDDYRLGMPLIFYLQNMNDLLSQNEPVEQRAIDIFHLSLAALSTEGAIMLPIEKNKEEEELMRKRRKKREDLVRKARLGDESAVENMTIEDMDTYSIVQKQSRTEDVYSLVDTYFMPIGIECDHYSILGEIKDYREDFNTLTGEEILILDIVANDMFFDVCINRKDLQGEPEIGRRFKGEIWMQGSVEF